MAGHISLIMPVMNGEKHLERALEFFLAQDHAEKELVIVDGKSTDGSHEIIGRYARKHKEIIWIKEEDAGISDAINIGIHHAAGDIIGYLGGDDLLYKGVLAEVAYLARTLEFEAVYFDSITYMAKAAKPYLRKCPPVPFSHESLMLHGTLAGLQNIYFKRQVFDTYKYNPKNRWSMDFELYLELTRERELAALYVERVGTINIFDGNITQALEGKQRREMIEVAKRFRRGTEPVFYEYKVPTSAWAFLRYKLMPEAGMSRRYHEGWKFWEVREEE